MDMAHIYTCKQTTHSHETKISKYFLKNLPDVRFLPCFCTVKQDILGHFANLQSDLPGLGGLESAF